MANITIRTRANTSAHLLHPRPQDNTSFERWIGADDNFIVYVHVDVLDFIRSEASRAMPNETIGLLAGRVCEDPQTGPYTIIMAAENARDGEFEASPAHVRLRGPGQTYVRRRLEDAHPDREIVGWYHTHPGYPPVFSNVDMQEQRTWTDRNHIGIVYSTSDHNEPFGVYRSSDANRLRPIANKPPPPRPIPLPPAEPVRAYLTPRREPLEVKNEVVLNKTPAALPRRSYLLALSIMALVIVFQLAYIFWLNRHLSYDEGRIHELSASRVVLDEIVERVAIQTSAAPAPKPVESSGSQIDGPELSVPAKSLKPETATQKQEHSQRRRKVAPNQPRPARKPSNAKRNETKEEKAGANKTSVTRQTPPTPAAAAPKPERIPQ